MKIDIAIQYNVLEAFKIFALSILNARVAQH